MAHLIFDANTYRWDLVGQELVSKLGDTLITAAGQALKAYTENMNPTARASTGLNMFENLEDGGKQNEDGSTTKTIPPPTPQPESPEPKNSNDPAYVDIKPAMVYLKLLNAILFQGPDGGVKWDEVANTTEDATSSALFVSQMLKHAGQDFATKATTNEPSVQFQKVLSVSIKVCLYIINFWSDLITA